MPFSRSTEDTANSTYQRMVGRYQNAASQAAQAASYIRPEILAIPAAKIKKFLADRNSLPTSCCSNDSCATSRTRSPTAKKSCWRCRARWRRRPSQAFRQLTDADMKFGDRREREGRDGRTEPLLVLGRSCIRPSGSVRKKAFHQYYAQFAGHENTLAATLSRFDPARRLLRPGAQLLERARGVAVSRQRAGRACTTT